jgi:phage anti-repressor protein
LTSVFAGFFGYFFRAVPREDEVCEQNSNDRRLSLDFPKRLSMQQRFDKQRRIQRREILRSVTIAA